MEIPLLSAGCLFVVSSPFRLFTFLPIATQSPSELVKTLNEYHAVKLLRVNSASFK